MPGLSRFDRLLETIREFRPGLIFMDHFMPEMNGIVATRRIKTDEWCGHIPVVYFSSALNIQEMAAYAGADDWLCKPFSVENLVRLTQKFL